MTDDVKVALLKSVSAAITNVQDAINKLEQVHPIARDTDLFKMLSRERDNLRLLLPQITKLRLS